MAGLIIGLLEILLATALITGVFLAALWLLRYIGLPVPPAVDKFGLVIIVIIALIWLVSLVFGGSPWIAVPHFPR